MQQLPINYGNFNCSNIRNTCVARHRASDPVLVNCERTKPTNVFGIAEIIANYVAILVELCSELLNDSSSRLALQRRLNFLVRHWMTATSGRFAGLGYRCPRHIHCQDDTASGVLFTSTDFSATSLPSSLIH